MAKVFCKSKRAPGKRVSPDHFQAFVRMLAPDWAEKILWIIVPNRWTVTSESLSCVLTRHFISIYIREPQKSRGIISDVGKKYISRSTRNFHLDWSEESKIVACLPVCDALAAVRHTPLIEEAHITFLAKLNIAKNNSKIRMWVCLHVLNTVLYFNSLVLPFFRRNYTCKKRRFASLRSPQSAAAAAWVFQRIACKSLLVAVLQASTAGEKPFQKPVFIRGHVCLSISFYRLSRVGLENCDVVVTCQERQKKMAFRLWKRICLHIDRLSTSAAAWWLKDIIKSRCLQIKSNSRRTEGCSDFCFAQ